MYRQEIRVTDHLKRVLLLCWSKMHTNWRQTA